MNINPKIFQILVLRSGLRMYDQHKMKPNRQWTPSKMLKLASELTGETFKGATKYADAHDALGKLLPA